MLVFNKINIYHESEHQKLIVSLGFATTPCTGRKITIVRPLKEFVPSVGDLKANEMTAQADEAFKAAQKELGAKKIALKKEAKGKKKAAETAT
jgi:hypothetical protein